MPLWTKLKHKMRRLLGFHVPVLAWHVYADKDGETKSRPIYADQFYKTTSLW